MSKIFPPLLLGVTAYSRSEFIVSDNSVSLADS